MVRIISIHDKIDSRGELFPDTTAAEVLTMFGSLPEEVAVLRKSSDRGDTPATEYQCTGEDEQNVEQDRAG